MIVAALDIGSTTVKGIVAEDGMPCWRAYQRHDTHQARTCLDFLTRMQAEAGLAPGHDRVYLTGSGAGPIAPMIGARFVQEVVAVAAAVEALHPQVHFVSEIGGEDMKTLFLTPPAARARPYRRVIPIASTPRTGARTPTAGMAVAAGAGKQVFMQSACSGGTGTFIEKTARKLDISTERLASMPYTGLSLHKISSKCGIFAEADANTLVKSGVPVAEIIASLFEAVVYQNLATLTKGNTPLPEVLLLGGPNQFFTGLQQAWRHHLAKLWAERGVTVPDGRAPDDLIRVPDDALYYACLGCVAIAASEPDANATYAGCDRLRGWIEVGQHEQKAREGARGLAGDEAELRDFMARYARPAAPPAMPVSPPDAPRFLGCDFGSTTAKAVVLSPDARLLFLGYAQSKGNPLEDAKALLSQVHAAGHMTPRAVAITGYGKDLLRDVLGADVAIVETVAHATAALHYVPDADVICDVGGCDVKIMLLRRGTVADFRLNSQCSSGNGAFLQGVAERYAVPLEAYAERAFAARSIPSLAMGCGVFLQSDIVNQQRKGWAAEEIMAGLAAVLPQNVWIYAGQLQNLAQVGRKFVLQGGTHRNLAVVKAQVDFIRARIPDADIVVHPHPGEAGAIGAALCALAWAESGAPSRFRGFEAIAALRHRSTTSDDTVCRWCPVNCRRTFIDVELTGAAGRPWSKVALASGWERIISGNSCPKGLLEDVNEMRVVKARLEEVRRAHPNVAEALRDGAFRAARGPRPTADRHPESAQHVVDPPVLAGAAAGAGD